MSYFIQSDEQKQPQESPQTQIDKSQRNVLAGTTSGCFSGGWNARKKITFNNSSGSTSTLVNFPVLVKLDNNRINYSKTKDNGADLRFEDPSSPGNFLPYEIETWNPSGTSYVWVKVPQIDASNSDYIWMYYDNDSASDAQQRNSVWDSSYKGVWHLGSIFYDSTGNGNHGTNNNTTSGEGLMGNASNFAGTSTADQYISVPNSSSINFSNTQNYTIEAWVKLPSDQNHKTNPDNDIISKWTHDTSPPVNPYPYNLRTTNSSSAGGAGEIYSNRYDANGVNPNCSSLPNKFNNNTWQHIAAIKSGTNLTIYVNGSQVCASSDTTTTTTTNSDPLHFGRRVSPRNWLTGSIDEVRISNTNRSAAWISAANKTGKDEMNSFGAEESCPTVTPSPTIKILPTATPTPKPPTSTPKPAQTSTSTSTSTTTSTSNSTTTQTQTYANGTLVNTPTPVTYYSNTSGSAPIGGYADPATNSNSTTNSQTGTTTLQSGSGTTQNTDRLASLDQTTVKCINSLLTPEELDKLRYLQPKIPAEEAQLNTLQDKVKICFESYATVVKIQEASKQISELPPTIKQCVVSGIGLTAYEQIQGGVRQPTQEEKVSTKNCFASQEPVKVSYQTSDQPLSASVDSCLVLALGNDRYNELKITKQQPTLSEKEKVNRCFGVNPNPLTGRPKYTVPASVDTCIKTGITESRYLTIKSGQKEPTADEKTKANVCFSKLNTLQTQLLSAPPVQVPYLKTDTTKININAVTPTTETTVYAKKDSLVVLKGKALPNSLVQLYVFSDPIVVETVTDQNGEWVYKLNEPLDKGTHVAYATVRDYSGEQVRSSVFNFNIAKAAQPVSNLGQQYFAENDASSVPSRFIDSSLIMIGGSLILGVIIFMIIMLKHQQAKLLATNNSLKREGDGENTSGPVN